MKFNTLRNNFSSGLWSGKATSRSDAEQYSNACKELKNFIPLLSGGVSKRPGTYFPTYTGGLVSTLVDGKVYKTIVASFVDSDNTVDEWSLCFTQNSPNPLHWARRTRDGLVVAIAPAAIIDVNVDADFFARGTEHYTQVGNFIIITWPEGDREPRVITRIRKTSDGSAPTSTRSFGMYLWSDFAREVEVNGEVYDVFQKEYEAYQFLSNNLNNTNGTVTPSATTGTITLTASKSIFRSSHVRSLWKIGNGSSTGVVRITAYTSPTVVSATVLATLPGTGAFGSSAGTFFAECAFNGFRGYPKSVTNYQGRLIFGGNPDQPSAITGSKIGAPFFFMEQPFTQDSTFSSYTQNNARPFTLFPATEEASDIRGLIGSKNLIIFTDKYEIVARGTSGAFGPNDFSIESTTAHGASKVQPLRVAGANLYNDATYKTIREVTYNFDSDEYISPDLAFLVDDLLQNVYENVLGFGQMRIHQMTYTREPNILWVLLRAIGNTIETIDTLLNPAGQVIGLHLDKDYKFNAWFEVNLKDDIIPWSIAGMKDGLLISTDDDDNPLIIMDAPRLNNRSPLAGGALTALVNTSMHMDLYNTQIYTGFNPTFPTYYRGKTVSVVIDGIYYGEHVVPNDGVLDVAGITGGTFGFCTIGFLFNADLQTLPIELGNQIPDSPSGRIKRVDEVVFEFYRTSAVQYGKDFSEMYDLELYDFGQNQGDYPPLFTGTSVRSMDFGYDRKYCVSVRSRNPFPCVLMSLAARGVTYD